MTVQWALSWWNLIFILPFGLGLLYLGIYTLSGWTFGDADAGVDHDVDAQLEADGHLSFDHDADTDLSHDAGGDADAHDAGHDASHEASHDADQDHDNDSESSSEGAVILTILNWFGVGRVPLSIILMVLLMSWGVAGFITNRAMVDRPLPVVAIAAALVGSLAITRVVTAAVAKYLPTNETYARRRHELLGSVGEALYNIDDTFGMACGRDAVGEQFQVPCRVETGRTAITKGTKVQLVGYTAKDHIFYVVATETGDSLPRASAMRTVANNTMERGSL